MFIIVSERAIMIAAAIEVPQKIFTKSRNHLSTKQMLRLNKLSSDNDEVSDQELRRSACETTDQASDMKISM
jgi:hypothetical protein